VKLKNKTGEIAKVKYSGKNSGLSIDKIAKGVSQKT